MNERLRGGTWPVTTRVRISSFFLWVKFKKKKRIVVRNDSSEVNWVTVAALTFLHVIQVCNYVNGMLYSVLGVARVKARAREINLANIVKEKLDRNHCNDDSKQLPIILKILDGGKELFPVLGCRKGIRRFRFLVPMNLAI